MGKRYNSAQYLWSPLLVIASVPCMATTVAQAQTNSASDASSEPPNAVLGDIVVTAQKRSTSLQKTPISITAVEGDTLQKAQIRSLVEVKNLVPAMQMGDNGGYAQITIRGIGISSFVPGADSAVALNMNEVYVSRPIAQLTGLYDVASLEALRGPQGTLYGRNATAGSINIATARPTDEWSGYGRVAVGSFNAVNVEGAVGGPIAGDMLMVRVAGFIDKRSGYGRNLVTGNDVGDLNSRGIRGTIVFQPAPNLKATIIADYFKQNDHNAGIHYFGAAGTANLPGASGVVPLFIRQGGYTVVAGQDVAAGRDSKFRLRTTSVTGILEWSLGAFSVKSISGYRDQNSFALAPLDAGSTDNAFYVSGEPAHQFSEEIQLHYDTDRLHLTGGVYYFDEKDSSSPGNAAFKYSVVAPGQGLPPKAQDYFVDFVEIGGTLRTTAKAIFGEASYEVIDGLTLIGGIRYSKEKKVHEPRNAGPGVLKAGWGTPWMLGDPQPAINFRRVKTFTSTTPKLGLQYELTPKTLLYATYAKGFKSGGFDVTTTGPAFEPEKVTDYEGGIKTTLFDNKLRLAVSGFYYDYSNLQVLQLIGLAQVTQNAGSAKVYGGELEFTALVTPELQVNGATSLLHARYKQYCGPSSIQTKLLLPAGVCQAVPSAGVANFSGRRLSNSPDFSGNIGATYTWSLPQGNLALRGEMNYTTKFYFSPDNIDILGQKGFVKENAFLTYTSNAGWHMTAFIRNIGNITTKVSGNVNSAVVGSPARGSVAPPRTYGMELGYKF